MCRVVCFVLWLLFLDVVFLWCDVSVVVLVLCDYGCVWFSVVCLMLCV